MWVIDNLHFICCSADARIELIKQFPCTQMSNEATQSMVMKFLYTQLHCKSLTTGPISLFPSLMEGSFTTSLYSIETSLSSQTAPHFPLYRFALLGFLYCSPRGKCIWSTTHHNSCVHEAVDNSILEPVHSRRLLLTCNAHLVTGHLIQMSVCLCPWLSSLQW